MQSRRELTLKEIQEKELEILVKIDEFCKKHNIEYFITKGTLLGAKKYKKFIPWDDDIDITMKRNEYNKFLQAVEKEDMPGVKTLSIYNSKNYFYPYAKVVDTQTYIKEENKKDIEGYGVFVDIFPLDGLPLDEKEKEKFIKKITLYNNVITALQDEKIISKNKAKKLFKTILAKIMIVNPNRFLKKLDKAAQKYDVIVSEDVMDVFAKQVIYKSSIFASQIDMEFENKNFKAPCGTEELLQTKFGNYLEELPKEKQKTHHKFNAYLR